MQDIGFNLARKKDQIFMANNQLSPLCILFVWFQCFCFFSIVHGDTNASPPVPTPINRHLYHSSEDLLEEIRALVNRHPDKLTLDSLKGRNQGYSAEIDVVTYRYRRQEEADDKQRFRILISFGQHGRELVTSEVALRILSILSEEKFLPDVDKASVDRTLENLVIKVVPMENLNGRRLVEAKDLCDRRNGRGVDLNRNWSVDWGKKEKDYDPYEENPGTAPFSEPEAQIMRKIAVSFDPHIWVNVHSGMEALFMPYDHKNTTPDGVPSIKMKSLLEELNRLHCHNHCMIGSGGGSVGYLAHGTATDFMYDIVKVPMAFTFEIYGDDTVASRDCFKMFNPTDVDTFNKVLHEWSAAFFTMFKLGPNLLGANYSKASNPARYKWMSTDEYLDGYLVESSSRYGMKTKVLDLGMQDIRTYFRLFLLSSVLLLFMFCSKILKNKSSRPNVTGTPL